MVQKNEGDEVNKNCMENYYSILTARFDNSIDELVLDENRADENLMPPNLLKLI